MTVELVCGDPNIRTTTDEARVVFPKTADSAMKMSFGASPSRPPASARNQNRMQPRTDGARSSARVSAPPIHNGVTASSSTFSVLGMPIGSPALASSPAWPLRPPRGRSNQRRQEPCRCPGVDALDS